MKFSVIFNRVKKHWPDKINIANGEILSNKGDYFSDISKAWDKAEAAFNPDDDWHGLMTWSMFKVIKCKARNDFPKKKKSVSINAIDIKEFEKEYFKDLHVEGYEDMLDEYIRDV